MTTTTLLNRAGKTVGITAAVVIVTLAAVSVSDGRRPDDSFSYLPATIPVTGVIRDFRERTASGGHPDFERRPDAGFGHYLGLVRDTLDEDGKPVFNSRGYRVTSQWRDAHGRNRMNPRPYISARSGDVNGVMSTTQGGAITSAALFAQWFRDVPGINLSAPLSLTMVRQPNSNMYSFNDATDERYMERGGFFPINGELLGNSGGSTPNQNFHFTFQLDTMFTYRQGAGQVFTFTGDDDVWVYIDNKLVIDIGGVHAAVSQTVELDRLNWLQEGHRYALKFFMVERHRTQANFRIDTSIWLENVPLPTTTALYD